MTEYYEEYMKKKKEYVENNRALIDETIELANGTIFPQYILWAKEVAYELGLDDTNTKHINDTFYFTEPLVNRLMLFSYLKGKYNIDKVSYKKGWDDCMESITRKLGFDTEGE